MRVRFMGRHSGKLWWDIKAGNGWLVLDMGRRPVRRGLRFPTLYWSPNATPWHHAAINLIGRPADKQCVCGCAADQEEGT